jgi:hypothetical protein
MSQLLALLTLLIGAAIVRLFQPRQPKQAPASHPVSRDRTIA